MTIKHYRIIMFWRRRYYDTLFNTPRIEITDNLDLVRPAFRTWYVRRVFQVRQRQRQPFFHIKFRRPRRSLELGHLPSREGFVVLY